MKPGPTRSPTPAEVAQPPRARRESPAELRAWMARLARTGSARTHDAATQAALAEARFRLAVHPDTSPAEAVELLEGAQRLDGSNPKYAYHLGRVCIGCGALDAAAFWLERAARLCPTSHRIWTHVAWLQLELNERYAGQADRYAPNALRLASQGVLARVRAGDDDIDPALLTFVPPAPAPAFDDPGERPTGDPEDGPAALVALEALVARLQQLAGAFDPHVRTVVAPALTELSREAAPDPDRVWSVTSDVEAVGEYVGSARDDGLRRVEALCAELSTRSAWATLQPRLQACRAQVLGASGGIQDVAGQVVAFAERVVPRPTSVEESRAPDRLQELLAEAEELAGELALHRLIDAAQCRWGGTWELEAERQLVGDPTGGRLVALNEVLARVAELAEGGRRGGAAAFAVLAIQALVRGYPPSYLARARATLTPRTSPALELLDRCLQLAALDEEALPPALAKALERGEVPPLLAALLHRRRILWRDALGVPTAAYSQALVALQDAAPEAVDEAALAQQLGKLRSKLDPKPAPPVKPPRKKVVLADSAEGVVAALEQLQRQARRFAAHTDALTQLYAGLSDSFQDIGDGAARANADATQVVVEALCKAGLKALELGLKRLADLKTTREGLPPSAAAALTNFPGDFDACSADMKQRPARFKRPQGALKKALKASKVPPQDGVEGTADAAAVSLCRELEALVSELSSPGDAEPLDATTDPFAPPPAPPAHVLADPEPTWRRGRLPALEEAVQAANRDLRVFLHRTVGSFEAYGRLPAGSPLERSSHRERLRAGVLLHRLGRTAEARRLWLGVSRENRLSVAASHNLAVSLTSHGSPGRALEAWQRHLAVLAAAAVIEEAPQRHAAVRTQLHRLLANAYGPRTALTPLRLDDKWLERLQPTLIAQVLQSRARTRAFVSHKLMELLTERMAFDSAPLVLGLRRDSVRKRDAARDDVLAFVRAACASLPAPAGPSLQRLFEARVEAAHEACGASAGLTHKKNPRYDEEVPRHREWLARVVHMKFKLSRACQSRDLLRMVADVGFVEELARLDAIPTAQSGTLLKTAVGPQLASDGVQQEIATLGSTAAAILVRFVFDDEATAELPESERAVDRAARDRAARRLADGGASSPALAEHAALLDAPQNWYPPSVPAAFDALRASRDPGPPTAAQRGAMEAGARDLRALAERFRFATEPLRFAVTLASALAGEPELRRGIADLEAAATRAITEEARAACEKARDDCVQALEQARLQASLTGGRFDEVESTLLGQITERPADPSLLESLAGAYCRWLEQDPAQGTALVPRIAQAFDRWLKGAPKHPKRPRALELKDHLLVAAAMGPLQSPTTVAEWRQIAAAMDRVLTLAPGSENARFTKMQAHYQGGALLSQQQDSAGARAELSAAYTLAAALANDATDPQRREQASGVAEQLRDIAG